jgi:tRNA threonylcarbamoyl adenosine modification protein YeaZ
MAEGSTLVIETSTPHASMVLVDADGTMWQRQFRSDRNHNALLFGPLRELLQPLPPASLAMVLVGSGPGSYSGTRVGIAAAQGVAIAANCPAAAIPSILAVPVTDDGAACLAIGDARRGSFWTALTGGFRLLEHPALCDAEELQRRVESARRQNSPVFSLEDPSRLPLPPGLRDEVRLEVPEASGLWRAWTRTDPQTRRLWSAEIPQPLYLKAPHITPSKRNLPGMRGTGIR